MAIPFLSAWAASLGSKLAKWLLIGAAIVVPFGIQTIRIEGLKFGHIDFWVVDFWIVNVEGFKDDIAKRDATIQDMKAAQKEVKIISDVIAEESDHDYKEDLDRAQAAARKYITNPANRVRNIETGTAPNSNNSPQLPDGGTQVSELVAVKPEDVEICTDDYIYAKGAHDWIKSLIREGVVVPVATTTTTAEPELEAEAEAEAEASSTAAELPVPAFGLDEEPTEQ